MGNQDCSHKKCKLCGGIFHASFFSKNNASKDKLQSACKDCDKLRIKRGRDARKEEYQEYCKEYRNRKKNDFVWRLQGLLNASRQRAALKTREHTITRQDLIDLYPVDGLCPIFGFKLEWNSAGFRETSPSIDRIDSSKGYTRDNIQIISWKANRIKNYATIDELEAIVNYMKIG